LAPAGGRPGALEPGAMGMRLLMEVPAY
jgi:hypothetical protein